MDPALLAFVVANLAPGVELLDDLDRQPLAGEHPVDRVLLARTEADVDPVGAERDEARQRQAGAAPGLREGRGAAERQGQDESDHAHDAAPAGTSCGHRSQILVVR